MSPIPNPYVGPRPFTQADSDRFFGREREARDLLSLVISERLVLFYAQSGAGKSSLLNTRLGPQLINEGFLVLPVGRVGGELPQGIHQIDNIYAFNLMLSLDQNQINPSRLTQLTLSQFLANLATTDGIHYYYDPTTPEEDEDKDEELPPVLLIDQFEEIITAHPDRWQHRADFFQQLEQAMRDDPLLWVVLILREDYVAALDPYASFLASKLRAKFYMQRMTYEAALEAITKPSAQAGRPFAPGVAERLVNNLRQIRGQGGQGSARQPETQTGEFVEPVQLQVVCYQLWDNLAKQAMTDKGDEGQADSSSFLPISYQNLAELGDVKRALAQFYENIVATAVRKTDVLEVDLRYWFDSQLITESGTRRIIYRGQTQTGTLANQTVDFLVEKYLIRAEVRPSGTWYELIHDRLIEPIAQANQTWFSQQPLIQFARTWKRKNYNSGRLLTGDQLAEALQSNWHSLGPLVGDYLKASQEAEAHKEEALQAEREAQKQRELDQAKAYAAKLRRQRFWILAISAITVLMALGLAVMIVFANRWAEMAERAVATVTSSYQEAQVAQAQAERYAQAGTQEAIYAATVEAEATQNLALAETEATDAAVKATEAHIAQARAEASDAVVSLAQAQAASQVEILNSWTLADQAKEALAKTHYELALLLAIEAGRARPTAKAFQAIRLALAHSQRIRLVLDSQGASVVQVAWHPTQDHILTADGQGLARVWDLMGDEIWTLRGHQAKLNQVIWNEAGSRILTASDDGTARVWDNTTGQEILRLTGHQGSGVTQARWSPDESRILTASTDGTARIWDAQTGNMIDTLRAHTAAIRLALWNKRGSLILTASDDGTARIWDHAGGYAASRVLSGHEGPVRWIAWSPNETQIVTAGADGTVRIWDGLTAQLQARLIGHTNEVNQALWNAAGDRLLTLSADLTARVWDAATGETLSVLSGYLRQVWQGQWSRDDRHVLTASWDGTARIWDTETGIEEIILRNYNPTIVNQAIWNDDETQVLTANADGSVRLWDLSPLEELPSLGGHEGRLSDMRLSRDQLSLLTASWDATVRLWDIETGRQILSLAGHTQPVSQVQWSPDEAYILTASLDGTARLWDAQTGQSVLTVGDHAGAVTQIAWNQAGDYFLTADVEGTIRVWDATTGEQTLTFTGHTAEISRLVWHQDAGLILTGSFDNTARLWDSQTGQTIAVLAGHTQPVTWVDWSSDLHRILTASRDQTARIWDAGTGQTILTLEGHSAPVNQAIWRFDDQSILTASWDNTARLWEAETGTEVLTLFGHTDNVIQAQWRADQSKILTFSTDRTVRLWQTETGQALMTLKNQADPFSQAIWGAEARHIIAATESGQVKQYYAHMTDLIAFACQQAPRNLTPDEWARYIPPEPYRATCDNLPLWTKE